MTSSPSSLSSGEANDPRLPTRRSRRLRVLTVIDRAVDSGGAERFAVGLAQNLPRDRIESWLCSTRVGDPDFAAKIAASGIPHVTLGRTAKWDVHKLGGLVRLLIRGHFDVLHAHKFGSNVWCSLFGEMCRVPVIIAHEHTWSYSGDPLRMLLDGYLIGRIATRFIAVSAFDAERMVSLEHVSAEKVICIPTAYIPRRSGPETDVRVELGLKPGTPLVGVAASLRPQKALSVLVEAHAKVLAQVPNAHLVIAGDGKCRQMLKERADRLGIAGRVHFLGRRDDVESIIKSLDVAALSSDFEGLPLFVLECMANGKPFVGTDVGGMSEVVKEGVTGLLVKPRDPDALAAALASLLRDDERRIRFGRAARESVDAYAIGKIAARFADLYEDLIAAKLGRALL
jgi:glycosyltransferase involved in cell wall biosynthesis